MKKLFISFCFLLFSVSLFPQMYQSSDMFGEWVCYKIVKQDFKTDKVLEVLEVNQLYNFYYMGRFNDLSNPDNPRNGTLVQGTFSRDGVYGDVITTSRLTIEEIQLDIPDISESEYKKNRFKIWYMDNDSMVFKGCEDGYNWGDILYFHYFRKVSSKIIFRGKRENNYPY